MKALNYVRIKEKELTTYPMAKTDDTVMADWFGEWNRTNITNRAKLAFIPRETDKSYLAPYLQKRGAKGASMPPYLRRRFGR